MGASPLGFFRDVQEPPSRPAVLIWAPDLALASVLAKGGPPEHGRPTIRSLGSRQPATGAWETQRPTAPAYRKHGLGSTMRPGVMA